MDDLVLRPAAGADWPEVAALLRDAALPLDGADEHLPDFIIAETAADGVLGCAALERYDRYGLLRSLAVAAEARGRGLGGKLVHALLDGDGDCDAALLLTTTAARYFTRFGFREIERERVPAPITESIEFTHACPLTATVMIRRRIDAREATILDAAAIAGIYNQGIEDRVATFETNLRSAEEIAAQIAEKGGRYPTVVVERSGAVVAWAGCNPYSTRPCYRGIAEFSVYTERSARGTGAGRLALGTLIAMCEERGFWKLTSRIFPENVASLALCHHLGFRVVGVHMRHDRLDGVWRDCVIVERLLGQETPS